MAEGRRAARAGARPAPTITSEVRAGGAVKTNLKIDGGRLWASLMEMAKIGATEKGGVCRLALSDLDREGRLLFMRWAEAAGCRVRVDAMGNIFARRPGRDPTA